MDEPVIRVESREAKPVFNISNFQMIVHAGLIFLITSCFSGVIGMVLFVVGALIIFDNINRHALSLKALIPFTVLFTLYFASFVGNFIMKMSLTINNGLLFLLILSYINIYMWCIVFNFNLIKEFSFFTKEQLSNGLVVASSVLNFLCIPVSSYALTTLIPSLTLYIPYLFVGIHIITSPQCKDPILTAFVSIITMIASVFSYLELNQLFVIAMPFSFLLALITPHVNYLSLISVPIFVGSCVMLLTDNILYFALVGVITLIFILSIFKSVNLFESTVLFGLLSFLAYMILSNVFNEVIRIVLSCGIGIIAYRLRFPIEIIPFISVGCATFSLFTFLHLSFSHITFHITRFIIFNLDLRVFTILCACFACYTLILPFLMTKLNRSIFNLLMIGYSIGLATIEYIAASRRNGVFYQDFYCVFTAIVLTLVSYLMLKTKKIYLTGFAVVVSFQIAKLSMFIFPRYLSIISIAIYLSAIIIRQTYKPNVDVGFIYFIFNQIFNSLASAIVSTTFLSILHVMFFNNSPTLVQTSLEALFLVFVLSAHECYVSKSSFFSIPLVGCFASSLAVLLSLGAESALDQLLIFFIVASLLLTSTNSNYSITRNFLSRLIFTIACTVLIAHYLFTYLPIQPLWYFFVLLFPTFCGLSLIMETVCYNKRTSSFLVFIYILLVLSFPLSLGVSLVITTNLLYLRSIASIIITLHFTLHVLVLVSVNISERAISKNVPKNVIMTFLSAPWSIIMGLFLHYFVLNGSSIVLILFAPLIELVNLGKYLKVTEKSKSALVVIVILAGLPLLTLSSILKYGFDFNVIGTYTFVILWSIVPMQFCFYLYKNINIIPFAVPFAVLQFVISAIILCFTTNDLMFTECIFCILLTPFSLYIQLKKESPKELVL